MMSFFLNPWTMAAGVALASTPIIIHLINRMRFRRVKWAAMEFLLKAQKKMRRKKVLEQLLLLLLRVLLVLLAGLLLARFLGSDPSQGKETRPVLHVILLDDTASMADAPEGAGPNNDAFSRAKVQVTDKILAAAAKATSPQAVRVVRLSDQADIVNTSPDPDQAPEAVTTGLADKLRGLLAGEKPVEYHVGLPAGLAKVKEYLGRVSGGDTAKVVHVVSDMRAVDWARDAEAITQAVRELNELGAKVHLVDVAAPNRKPDRKTPAHSDNVGIVELKPRSRVAAEGREVEFELRVKNYGNADLKEVRAEVFVNGQVNFLASVRFETLPAGQEAVQGFEVKFDPSQGATVATREDPLARFNVVTAVLRNTGSDAIPWDNVRHAVVEVREKQSVLLVTRAGAAFRPGDKGEDGFYLRNLFEIKFSGVEVVSDTPDALAKRDLREFASVYLVNVPTLNEAEARNLERYAREGGGVGVFLGPDVTPEPYNKLLYKDGQGLFPFPLGKVPEQLSAEDRAKRGLLSGGVFTKRVLARDSASKTHPALRGIYQDSGASGDKDTALKVESTFLFVAVDNHWKIERIGRWREDKEIQELYCLPNEEPASNFQEPVRALARAVEKGYAEPKFEKYRAALNPLLAKLQQAAAPGPDMPPLPELARQLDKLLSDQISEGDALEALLREFWGHPEQAELKRTAQALRDSTKYGDPLYVARRFGGGRVAVLTTDAGGANPSSGGPWTDWPSGPGGSGWVAVMTELQKYLGAGGAEENRVAGAPVEFAYEAGRYKPEARWLFRTFDAANQDKANQALPEVTDPPRKKDDQGRPLPLSPEEGKPLVLVTRGGGLNLTLPGAGAKHPGVYVFALDWQKRDGDPPSAPASKKEYVAAAVNFDTEREGDLKRANTDEFKTVAKGAEDIHSPEDDGWLGTLEQKPTDLSSGRWVYLVILLVLIFEQAWAVKLSYHSRPDELETFAPSAAAAMAGRAAPPPADADAPAESPAA